ncbi:hypothetical protein LguiB_001099 [Lonicera macranthoides]
MHAVQEFASEERERIGKSDGGERIYAYVVLSKIRTGLKCEFAFTFKSQSEFSNLIGRTRSTRSENRINMQFKSFASEEGENGLENPTAVREFDVGNQNVIIWDYTLRANFVADFVAKSTAKRGSDRFRAEYFG